MWLTGLLEGEGTFGSIKRSDCRKYMSYVAVMMSDPDVIEKAAKLMQCIPYGPYKTRNRDSLPLYIARVERVKARRLMKLVYPFIGARRQAQITYVLQKGDSNGTT
jgi:hypothetical protein